MTEVQQRICAAIRELTDVIGYPPTVREIAQAVGLSSTSTVAHHLTVLEREGVITHTPRHARSYRVRRH